MKKKEKLKKVPKNIYFSERQVYLGGIVADEMGMKFSEWVQYLVAKGIEASKSMPSYLVSEETEKEIGKSLRDFEEGRYVSFKDPYQMKKYLHKLVKEGKNG